MALLEPFPLLSFDNIIQRMKGVFQFFIIDFIYLFIIEVIRNSILVSSAQCKLELSELSLLGNAAQLLMIHANKVDLKCHAIQFASLNGLPEHAPPS